MGWTADQKKAIDTDTGSGNLLVSAAAGSGKTAVLVERVLEKIIAEKTTIDRLLIVTFTEAAASEMRQKIVKRLLEYIKNGEGSPEKHRLIKDQIRLTQTADISTIDGFCNRVVQNNFHTLGIDPDIRICDSAMANLMTSEAMDSLFLRIYKSEDEDIKARFRRLTDFYAKDRDNEGLKNVILSIYHFTESFADPKQWLKDSVEYFDLPTLLQPSVKYHLDSSKNTAKIILEELALLPVSDDNEINLCKKKLENTAQAIYDADSWDDIYKVYSDLFSKPKKRTEFISIADELPDSPQKESIKFLASLLCDVFSPGKNGKIAYGITMSKEDTEKNHDSEILKAQAEDLVWIVSEFIDEYENIKQKRNLCEFSDIEHLTYRLFSENETIRNEYRDKYDEILIDEYQDTNMLQNSIFELISKNNTFMVGDLKQSIYRFRKGDPYIFKSKSQSYGLSETCDNLIMLSQNFRSRKEVLDSVNDVFTKIMSETAGDVDYKNGELIVRDDEYEYYPTSETDMKSELHYIALDKNSDIDRDLCEARYTAMQIKKLLESDTQVYDKSTGTMRPIQKRDIVILENSVKYNSELITDELSQLGIASYVDKSSFFDRREINIMLSLITIIDNSHNDIPLISVMRSPIGGFSDEELALIRVNEKHTDYFIDAVKAYSEKGEDKRLAMRCGEFVRNIRRWRDYVRKKSVAQLIWSIYEETCFYDIMGAIEEGEEAQTNLRLLYERAKEYESAGFKGLFNFVKYIDRLEGVNNDVEGAKLIGENHDVVRIMTIHKSKGLEFPYVFLLGAGRDFPLGQDLSVIRMHKSLGFGLPYINYERHYSQKTRVYELISKINKAENMSERMRLLYVAMTRPREKLFVVAVRNHKPEETKEDILRLWQDALIGNRMLPSIALNAKGFYDWICPSAFSSPDTWSIHFTSIKEQLDSMGTVKETQGETYGDSKDLRDRVYDILDYSYPYSESNAIPQRTSVTQLKELSKEHIDEYEPESRKASGIDDIANLMLSPLHSKPKFLLEDSTKPPNEIGTLYHLVMAEIDIDAIRKNGSEAVSDEIEKLILKGRISRDDATYIDYGKVRCFFESPLGKRLLKSGSIYREKQFQIHISALDYDPSLSDMTKNEKVILQGIIDCFFEEDGSFILFDYKTDKVRNGGYEIKERYKKQLELYKKAIEELTNKKVSECYLYLFDTNEIV